MISLIISVFQQPVTLRLLLECLEQQTYTGSWEVIVCDDGSGSDIHAIVDSFARSSSVDIRYLWQPDYGFRAARSRNNGIRCAKGDLLVFLDGDILIPPDFLIRHHAAHDGSSLRVVAGSRKMLQRAVEDESALTARHVLENLTVMAEPDHGLQDLLINNPQFPWVGCQTCNLSIPRRPEVMFDENFVGWGLEDWELACRLYHRHQYHIVLDEDIEGIHLDLMINDTTPKFNQDNFGCSPKVIQIIKNHLYFRAKYPDLMIAPVLQGILYCNLDEATDEWYTRSEQISHNQDDPAKAVNEALDQAQAWLVERGIEGIQPHCMA